MSKSIDTLVEDIEALFEGHTLTEVGVDKFAKELSEGFSSRFKDYGEDRKPSLRLSNYGRPLRQLWYELKSFPREKLSSSVKLKFLYGDVLESVLLMLAVEAGHSVTDLQRAVEAEGVVGHLDAVIDGVVVDVKSASTYSFHKFKDGSIRQNDPFGYIPQLAGYSHGLGGIDGAFLVVDKTLGNIHLEKFSKEELAQYDVEGKIFEDRKAVSSDIEPKRCYSDQPVSKTDKTGNMVLSVPCQYCGWKAHCWRDSNEGAGLQMRLYSTGPKWFTKLVKEPKLNNSYAEQFTTIKESA